MNAFTKQEIVTIAAPKFERAQFEIVGTAPLVMAAFSEKARQKMREKHEAGSTAKSKKEREARDFAADCEAALHRLEDSTIGFPASAWRAAMIDACRLVGFKMTMAKMSVFVEADGLDLVSGQPLVRIIGDYEQHVAATRNQTGVTDLRSRPMFRRWSATLRVRWDGDQFRVGDVSNLLARAGMQIGVGEGRPFSRESYGLGWGTFEVVS
jgi:hypothetical protein